MALRYATKTGNWSDTTVWDGGTLPATTDDVFANTYTVTIDQDITVLTLRNVANTTPAITAGGGFVISTVGAGVTRNVSITNGLGNVGGAYIGASPLLLISATSGTVALGSTAIKGTSTGSFIALSVTGTGVTLTGSGTITGGTAGGPAVSITSAATASLGPIVGSPSASATNAALLLNTAASNVTVASLTGGGASGLAYYAAQIAGGNPTLTVSGAIVGGSNGASSYGLYIQGACTVSAASVSGGTSPGLTLTGSSFTATVTISGSVTAGTVSAITALNGFTPSGILILQGAITASSTAPAVSWASTTVPVIRAAGPLTHGPNGHQPINAPTWMCKPTATAQSYNVYDDTNSPATGVLRSLTNVTSGNQGPAPADVRTGTAYGAGLVGTMAVPAASSVASGVSVDATTGTAAVTGASVWTHNVDTGVQAKTRLLAASTLASDGAAIAAALTA